MNGQTVTFSTTGALPLPLVAGTTYYVVNQVSGKFELSLTVGGASIATTNVGSGVHRIGPIGQPTSKMAESPPSMAFPVDVNVLQTFPVTGTVGCFTEAGSSYVIYSCDFPVEE